MPHRTLAVATALALFGLTACWNGISVHVLATVLAVRGDVTAIQGKKSEAVTADSVLSGGTLVRTAAGAEVDLMLVPGVLVRLFENSELRIERLILVKDGNETAGGMISRTAHVRLNRGKVVTHFLEPADAHGELIIENDQVKLIQNPATAGLVAVDGKSTRALSAKGTIFTSPTSSTDVGLTQGFFQVWPSDVHHPSPAAEDAMAQDDLAVAVKAAQELFNERETNLPKANRFPRAR